MKMFINIVDIIKIMKFCKDICNTLLISKEKENYINIIFELDERIQTDNIKVKSDEFRLKKILLNFISNSVKFTKNGFIKIQTILSENTIKLSIEDKGVGMLQEDITKLFNDNMMFRTSEKYNQEGSGLGLSICKTIASKLNHKIEVKSQYGEGSLFSILIEYFILDKNKGSHIKSKIPNKKFDFSEIVIKQIANSNSEKSFKNKDDNLNLNESSRNENKIQHNKWNKCSFSGNSQKTFFLNDSSLIIGRINNDIRESLRYNSYNEEFLPDRKQIYKQDKKFVDNNLKIKKMK